MKKTNFVIDIGRPLLGSIFFAMGLLFWLFMYQENNLALKAERAGPLKIQFDDLQDPEDLNRQRVEISGARAGAKYSLTQLEHGTSGGFLLFPDQAVGVDPNRLPVILRDSTIESQQDAEQLVKKKKFTGVVSTKWFLLSGQQSTLEKSYPGLDLDRCVVIVSPPPSFDKQMGVITIGMMVVFAGFVIALTIQFVSGVRNALKHGATFSPSTEAVPLSKTPVLHYDSYLQPELGKIASSFKPEQEADYIPRFYSASYIIKLIGFVVGAPTIALASLGQVNLLPNNLQPIFQTLAAVSFGLILLYWAALLYQTKTWGTDVRWPIPEWLTLPRRFRRSLDRCERVITTLGFRCQGTFRMLDKRALLAREFLSDDGKTLHRYNVLDGFKIQAIYSLLNNGQLILTTDATLDYAQHPRINLIESAPSKFEETLSIHQQAVAGYQDVVVRIEPNELHAFWKYTKTLEDQLTGKLPIADVSLPLFRDLSKSKVPKQNGNESNLSHLAEVN